MTLILRTPDETLAYLKTNIAELRAIAARNDFSLLAYMLEMALVEVSDQTAQRHALKAGLSNI
jgi:hypothetical protein